MAVLHATYRSQARGGNVPFTAILPVEPEWGKDDYRPGPYPAIYLLHGFFGSHTDWLIHSRAAEWALESGYAVIMPEGLNYFYIDNADSGITFGDFTGRELVEATRLMFHLSPKREDTAIAGLSMGGYGALRNGLYFNDTFGAIIALSSALITEDIGKPNFKGPADTRFFRHVFGDPKKLPGSDKDPKTLAVKALSRAPRLYMACGEQDELIRQNTDFHTHLEAISYPHIFVTGPGGHTWDYWNQTLASGIKWLARRTDAS